jgi:hypothetical protein
MNKSRFVATMALVALASGNAAAGDLSKIDRTIGKEPAYQSKPKYCLVVVGFHAKTRVWLVVDGDLLYADRNSDGDLTGKDERFPMKKPEFYTTIQSDAIPVGEGADSFLLSVEVGRDGQEFTYGIAYRTQNGNKFRQRTCGQFLFADRPQDAPVVHFDGPLTLTILDWHKPLQPRQLVRGDKDNQLSILVGTPVFGGKHEAFAVVDEWFPKLAGGKFPVVKVEFPGKDLGAKPIATGAKLGY